MSKILEVPSKSHYKNRILVINKDHIWCNNRAFTSATKKRK